MGCCESRNKEMVEIAGEHKEINVAEFVSVLIYLAEESGKIIR